MYQEQLSIEEYNHYEKMMVTAIESFEAVSKLHELIEKTSYKDFSKIEKSVYLTFEHHKQVNGDHSKELRISTESHSSSRRKEIALEGIGEWLTKIWEMIVNFFKKLGNFFKGSGSNTTYKVGEPKYKKDASQDKISLCVSKYLFPGDSPVPESCISNIIDYENNANFLLRLMEISFDRISLYKDFLDGKKDNETLLKEIKKVSLVVPPTTGQTSFSDGFLNYKSKTFFSDRYFELQVPSLFKKATNLSEVANMIKCKVSFKNADKQEIDNYRKNLDLSNFSHANMMSIVGKDHQIALGIGKKHESVFSKFEPFVRKVGGISIDSFKTVDDLERRFDESDIKRLSMQKNDIGSAAKALLSEVKLYMIINNVLCGASEHMNNFATTLANKMVE